MMRDLKRYPITTSEIERCLLALADELAKEGKIGDMRPMILAAAARIVCRVGFVAHDIVVD
jgi:hypothetical protein